MTKKTPLTWATQHRAMTVDEFRGFASATVAGVCEIWRGRQKIAEGLLVRAVRFGSTRAVWRGVYWDETTSTFKFAILRGEVRW